MDCQWFHLHFNTYSHVGRINPQFACFRGLGGNNKETFSHWKKLNLVKLTGSDQSSRLIQVPWSCKAATLLGVLLCRPIYGKLTQLSNYMPKIRHVNTRSSWVGETNSICINKRNGNHVEDVLKWKFFFMYFATPCILIKFFFYYYISI